MGNVMYFNWIVFGNITLGCFQGIAIRWGPCLVACCLRVLIGCVSLRVKTPPPWVWRLTLLTYLFFFTFIVCGKAFILMYISNVKMCKKKSKRHPWCYKQRSQVSLNALKMHFTRTLHKSTPLKPPHGLDGSRAVGFMSCLCRLTSCVCARMLMNSAVCSPAPTSPRARELSCPLHLLRDKRVKCRTCILHLLPDARARAHQIHI